MNKGLKVALIILGTTCGILGLSVIGGAFFLNHTLDKALENMEVTEVIKPEEVFVDESLLELEEEAKVINIAVFGIDNNENSYDRSNSRSDATKIISLDLKNNVAKITSLQRDMLLNYPDENIGFDKLNHAYAYGGAALALKTINYNFDLDVTRYVTVNYNAVEHLVNLIDGVEINVSESERNVLNNYIHAINSLEYTTYNEPLVQYSGFQTLSGRQAVAYMRNRAVGSDYARMERQTEVILAAAQKLLKMNVSDILNVMNECLTYVETNLTKEEIIEYGMAALKIDLDTVEQYQFPINGYEDTMSSSHKGYSPVYIIRDYVEMVKIMHDNLYNNDTYEPTQTIYNNHQLIHETFGPWKGNE